MRKIQEHGIQHREVRKIYTRKPVCQTTGSNFVSVGLRDCYFPFVLFGGGVFVSVLLLFMEMAMKNYYQRHKHVSSNKHRVHELPFKDSTGLSFGFMRRLLKKL